MAESPFYTALPSARSIRLLLLHQGAGDEKISCSLEVVDDYSSVPPYYGLSYCWGDANDRVELSCNCKPFQVTRSLYTALHRLRQSANSHLVWADALCINQDDIAERNQQVSIMDKIFLQASRVLVWLGPGSEDTAEAMAMIQEIVHGIHDASGHDGPIHLWLLKMSARIDRALWRFYQAEWFFRVWVVQEVRQNLDTWVLCGHFEIKWNFVGLLASWVWLGVVRETTKMWERNVFPSTSCFNNASLMWLSPVKLQSEAPFLCFLDFTRSFRSTDLRDKVLALLHHSIDQVRPREGSDRLTTKSVLSSWSQNTPCTHLNLQPDYHLTKREVYREVALESLRQYRSLEVLTYAWQTTHLDNSWPSWIPAWDLNKCSALSNCGPLKYDATKGTNPTYMFNQISDSLTIKGLKVCSIEGVSSVLHYDAMGSQKTMVDHADISSKTARLITQMCWKLEPSSDATATRHGYRAHAALADFSSMVLQKMQRRRSESYIALNEIWCSECKTSISTANAVVSPVSFKHYHCNVCDDGDFDLCVHCFDNGRRCHVSSHTLVEEEAPSLCLRYSDKFVERVEAHAGGGNAERFATFISKSWTRLRFLKTFNGWHGAATGHVKLGDVVVVLFGSRVPFILRKHGSAYRLVCDCYVDGLMNGEAIEMWKNGEFESEEFEIR